MSSNRGNNGGRTVDKDWLEGRRNLSEESFVEAMDRSEDRRRGVAERARGTLATLTSLLSRRA